MKRSQETNKVAQVSQPAVSQCFQPANRPNLRAPGIFNACRLGIGDTAGWETCATSFAAPPNIASLRFSGFGS
jgi:hypothetical protein